MAPRRSSTVARSAESAPVMVLPETNGVAPKEQPRAAKDDVQGAMLEPAVANKQWVRRRSCCRCRAHVSPGLAALLPPPPLPCLFSRCSM
jgi:hypothetical protein